MKTKLLPVLFTAALFAISSPAQPLAPPSNAAPASTLVPNQTIYAAQLPSVQDLTNAAAAQGIATDRIEQTSTQITVVYKFQNGQTSTVAYLLLPTANLAPSAAPVVITSPAPTVTTVVTAPAPTVVYESAPRVVYYEPLYYSYPWYRQPPVSLRIGVGLGYHSGYHGGWRR